MTTITGTLVDLLSDAQVFPWDTWITQAAPPNPAIAPAPMAQFATQSPPPACVVCPETEAELAAVMACAHQNRWRVIPFGQGTKLAWGGVGTAVDLMVSTARLNHIVHHAVGDLTVTVEAGVKFTDLQAVLVKTHQFLALDPAYADQATLGGIVATADAGAWRQRYGGVRDMLIGLTLVRSDGQIAKAGGQVVKNVAGYDLMKLMTGAYGTLGIVSQLTFRTYPLPEASQTVVMAGESGAIAATLAALKQSVLTPVAFDLLSPRMVENLGLQPQLGLALQFQGIPDGVAEQVTRSRQFAQALNCQDLVGAADVYCWHTLGNQVCSPQASPNDLIVLKLGILPSAAVTLLTELELLLANIAWYGRIHVSSGVGRVAIACDQHNIESMREKLLKLRARCESERGFLTLLQAPQSLKQTLDVWGYAGSALPLMKRIKAQFDPLALLSPGRFVGDI
ncbi:MAG: FAD-binding oxidoreductase [Cyanobacteria bacterium P01_A01_bin.123]